MPQIFEIDDPVQNQSVPVRQGGPPDGCTCGGSGSGMPSGFICAQGIAHRNQSAVPQAVYGKILPAGASPPTNPTPDACTAHGKLAADGVWIISSTQPGDGPKEDVPCALCGSADAPAANTLFCWCVYSDGSIQTASITIYGVCSDKTECEENVAARASFAAMTASGTAPKVWHLKTKGFGKGKMKFNAGWPLTLVHESAGVWSNGGDGAKSVKVELSYHPRRPMEWQLVLTLRKTSIVYEQTNQNWFWTKGNDLIYTGGDPKKKGVPAKVHVSLT
jgi:hypothetical protein